MVSRFPTTIDVSGPFFTKDIRKTLQENTRTMLEAMAAEGEADVRAQWPTKTGAGRAGSIGRVRSLAGKSWRYTMIVSAQHIYPWKSHLSAPSGAQYRGGKVEARVHMFRRTTGRLRRAKAVNQAELTKGL